MSTAELEVLNGGDQEGVVGMVLPEPLVVRVSDAAGIPIAGARVQWVFTAGRGSRTANPSSATEGRRMVINTDAEGRAQVWWELGTRPGEQHAKVSLEEVSFASEGDGGPAGAPGGNGKGKSLGLRASAKTGSVAQIEVTPGEASVAVAGSLRLVASVTDAYGNVIDEAAVTWSVSDEAIATVDETGLVEPTTAGSVVVTAESGGVEGEAAVTTVSEGSGELPDTVVADPGRVDDLRGAAVSNSSVTLRWTAVDGGAGTEADYAVRVGSPTISWGSAGASQVLVSGAEIGTIQEHTWSSLEPGTTYEFQLVAYRGSFQDGTAVFSELSNIATAETTGTTEGSDPGEPQVGSLEITPSSAVITGTGGTRQLEMVARDSLGNTISAAVSWESLNPSVATVDGSGRVTAQSVGTALIVVAASCCSSDTAQVTVENQVSSSSGLLLHTNWTTGTGNSVAAVGDGGKGTMRWCNWSDVLSVVNGGSVGLPSGLGNALSIRSINSCGHVEYPNVFPRPTNGGEQFWAVRYYAMNGPGQTDTKMHPHTFWPVGSIEAVHLGITRSGSGGDWVMHPRWTFSGGEFPFGVWPKTAGGQRQTIAAGTWVRYEFILHWLNATQFRWYPRVYDMNGSLLWDEYDFRHTDNNLSLGDWYDASPSNVLTRARNSSGLDNIRTFAFGMGQAGSSGGRYYIADAAFALVSGPRAFIGAGRP